MYTTISPTQFSLMSQLCSHKHLCSLFSPMTTQPNTSPSQLSSTTSYPHYLHPTSLLLFMRPISYQLSTISSTPVVPTSSWETSIPMVLPGNYSHATDHQKVSRSFHISDFTLLNLYYPKRLVSHGNPSSPDLTIASPYIKIYFERSHNSFIIHKNRFRKTHPNDSQI